MLPFASSFPIIAVTFLLPTIAGLFILTAAAKFVRPVYLCAFAIGVYIWFFSDTVGGAAGLDVNAGFSGGLPEVALFALFALGLLAMFSLDSDAFTSGLGPGNLALTIPLLMAFAVGVHGFGEGAAFSSTAASTQSSNLLDAFGGPAAAAAFVLHKVLEPMMVGAAYCAYAKDRSIGISQVAKDILLLGIVFVAPGLIGAATDYSLAYDTTYPFALGLGTSFYAAVRLAKPLFSAPMASRSGSIRMALAVLLGFTCIFVAALLHS